ncbi:hypothetical protein [Streptomyces sparsus]
MLLSDAWRHWHRPLMLLAGAMAVTSVICALGLLLDDRTLVGAPLWLKPFKFSVSFLIYALSAAWLHSLLSRGRRIGGYAGTVMTVTAFGEITIIVGQAARGRRSHFNVETTLDNLLFQAMGLTVVIFWCAVLVFAVLLVRERLTDRAAALAIRSGLVLAVIGMALGGLMLLPGQGDLVPNAAGAHSVGVPDGGPGLPVTGWSTTGGDLRVPHFVGMHMLQALPLLVPVLGLASRRAPRLAEPQVRYALVRTAAGAAAGLIALLTWQAMRGQPLLAPDTPTLAGWAALLLATSVATVHALRRRPTGATAPVEKAGAR